MIYNFKNFFPENLHHSYIIFGDPEKTMFKVREMLEERNLILKNSNDLFFKKYDSFKIDDMPTIKDWHINYSISDNKKICILGAYFINIEASNTLLKILEEPKENTHFFIIIPKTFTLIEPIISRSHIVYDEDVEISDLDNFIKMNLKDKLEYVDLFLKERKDLDNSLLRNEAVSLINKIEKTLYLKYKKDFYLNLLIFKELNNGRKFLSLPGSSVKMILENIVFLLS